MRKEQGWLNQSTSSKIIKNPYKKSKEVKKSNKTKTSSILIGKKKIQRIQDITQTEHKGESAHKNNTFTSKLKPYPSREHTLQTRASKANS